MKCFETNTGIFTCEILEINKIPIRNEDNDISKSIIDDLYNICGGDGKISIEYLLVSDKIDKKIYHIIVIRSYDKSKDLSVRMNKVAFLNTAETLLAGGYSFEKRSFMWFSNINQSINRNSCWAMVKDEIVESDCLSPSPHVSLPVIDSGDIDSVYALLNQSDCSVSIQITPDRFSSQEDSYIQESYSSCSRALDGTVFLPQGPRDNLATFAKTRWEYYVQNIKSTIVTMNIIIMGDNDRVAMIVARIKSHIKDKFTNNAISMCSIPLNVDEITSFYDYPWKCERALEQSCVNLNNITSNEKSKSLCRKYSAEEAKNIFSFPFYDGTEKGVLPNAFSITKYNTVIPQSMKQENDSILLGKTLIGENVYLPYEDIRLHLSIYGKTGVGKTTFMLSLIEQLENQDINVLVLEPIKNEYRVLAKGGNTKVFTVETDVLPFVINPFYVPEGVSLNEYRPHLISAFSAAISLPDPLPSLLGKAISECYALYGWKGYSKSKDSDVKIFGLREFVNVYKNVIRKSGYSSEVKGNMISGGTFRLLSLIERAKKTFDNIHSIDVSELLNGNVVLELNKLEGEQRSLVTALTMISILSYLRTQRSSGSSLKNLVILDEAHALLDNGNISTEEGKQIDLSMTKIIENMVVEIRAQGVGIVIADQSPERLGDRLLNSTDTKIIFRLTGEEAKKTATAIGLDESEASYFNHLDKGEAIISNHYLIKPIGLNMCRSEKYNTETAISDLDLAKSMGSYLLRYSSLYKPHRECELCKICHDGCIYNTREKAYTIAVQLLNSSDVQIKDSEDAIKYLLAVSRSILRNENKNEGDISRLIKCTIIQFYYLIEELFNVHLSMNELSSVINKGISITREAVCDG